ncbi:glycoside hydrolase family 16 protein [Terriglobus saanensis]|uniref:Glucan endo-1,3-beta-D-glucosidase n=1 Tax=Terriglobus saanensis (strain ATCC BAA-1853 / DSM 23119 / SP1PR4) TaxID=401053 RepID=E8V4J0_TERSS|nr:glycoside hydrolase family 16 protein [Terriglobus saanensis]ADV84814.1 Glucan endo-1,3-beta-D-glucosidase [Terriglobus saanensis SP1PR4]
MLFQRLVVFLAAGIFVSSAIAQKIVAPPGWKLTWHDEFNGRDGSSPDPKKWVYDLGGSGWYNHELETYTARTKNVRMERGNLVIEAHREDFTGVDGKPQHFTSARLKTLGRFAQQYGRFEARIKIPQGRGAWPAFWMEGVSAAQVKWPACGEIDIMENIPKDPGRVYSTLHGPGFGASSLLQARHDLPEGQKLADDFHVYAVEWSKEKMTFFLDGAAYGSMVLDTPEHGRDLPFDQPFFMILNLAVGGDWPGPPDASTQFPLRMLVDYVRVYAKKN